MLLRAKEERFNIEATTWCLVRGEPSGKSGNVTATVGRPSACSNRRCLRCETMTFEFFQGGAYAPHPVRARTKGLAQRARPRACACMLACVAALQCAHAYGLRFPIPLACSSPPPSPALSPSLSPPLPRPSRSLPPPPPSRPPSRPPPRPPRPPREPSLSAGVLQGIRRLAHVHAVGRGGRRRGVALRWRGLDDKRSLSSTFVCETIDALSTVRR